MKPEAGTRIKYKIASERKTLTGTVKSRTGDFYIVEDSRSKIDVGVFAEEIVGVL